MFSELVIQTDIGLLGRLQQVGAQIGRTPLHRVERLFAKKGVELYAKKEWEQLSGSVKARAAFNIISTAVKTGELHRGKTLLDATSGNTGIAYAAIGKQLGIPVALCLPENASPDRKRILQSLGAEIIYTSPFEGTDGAQDEAAQLAAARPDRYFYADQYKNESNWKAHFYGTAEEILAEVPQITHFVAGLGTTGTFVGTGRRLKSQSGGIRLIGLQPDTALHGMEGWKHLETAKIPAIYDARLADNMEGIDTLEAYEMMRAAAKWENLALSPSSAANLVGAIHVAERLDNGVVVTVLPDNADKYTELIQRIF